MQYDYLEADYEDWLRFESLLERLDIEEETDGTATNKKLKKFYKILEDVADQVFEKKKEFIDDKNELGEKKPKNFIPRKIRQLMKKKSKLSGKIQASRKWWKTHEMLEEVESIEAELTEEYKKQTINEKEKAIKRSLKIQSSFIVMQERNLKVLIRLDPS